MGLKGILLIVLFIVSVIVTVFSSISCFDKQKKYQQLVVETPPKPTTIQMVDSLENIRTNMLADPEEVTTDLIIRSAMLNDIHDSILHTQEYINDMKSYEGINQRFIEIESKLNTQYLIGVLGVLVGFASGVWSSILFYSKRKRLISSTKKRYTGPEVKY